uniref:Uncharacterized protein n=1 Tax=Salix viminalis TaxID=40686 RepID=A0A6N2MKK3_SALVM
MIENKVTPSTPYHSAKYCSKCKFGKLETASYWLCHIKLAESVGKHSNAEVCSYPPPHHHFLLRTSLISTTLIGNLRVKLKRYKGQHRHFSYKTEWREVSHSYKKLKDESNVEGESSELEKGKTTCR